MEAELNRNYWLNGGVALAIGLVLSATIFGWFYSTAKKSDEAITVTGSAKRRITSDLVLWNAGVSSQAADLTGAYRGLSDNIPKIKQYLITKGIPEDQMTVSAITTVEQKGHDSNGNETSEVTGYTLSQQIEVRSSDVNKIAQIAREATELINQGILIQSSPPQYYYTKIGDLKIEMLGEASKDAKERAEWDASMLNFDADLKKVEAFLINVAEGKLKGDEQNKAGFEFFGVQGPWYTVGWRMASVIEQAYGRERLVESFCDESRLLKTYNSAAKKYEQKNEVQLARWSRSLLDSVDASD